MPKWFKLNDDRFSVHIDALKNPLGDLWRYIQQSHEEQNYDIEDKQISVTLSQYRDNGYGTYGDAYVTLYGTLRKDNQIIFTRYSTEQSPYYTLKDFNKNMSYETLVLWSIALIKESNRINKIPTVTFAAMNKTITTSKPIFNKIKRELKKHKRVFYLGCHDLACCTRYFAFLKANDPRIKIEQNKTAVKAPCPRHPRTTAYIQHVIGELDEVEITKGDLI